jgi:hypothetical protein
VGHGRRRLNVVPAVHVTAEIDMRVDFDEFLVEFQRGMRREFPIDGGAEYLLQKLFRRAGADVDRAGLAVALQELLSKMI